MTDIIWNEQAVEDLRELDRQVARRIVKKVGWLADNFEEVVPQTFKRGIQRLI